ncbi:IRF3 factor, partial [Trogon melanurus]|nr:IRF3 factor [Trogon melanurus]
AHREAQKLRFVPWLLQAVSSGCYQGLHWTNPALGAFRIPWKHNSRKDVTSSDLEIFKVRGRRGDSWQQTGVFEVGGVGGLSRNELEWKTNFRCAMSSTHMFTLLEDRSKCGDDPHKIF